MVVIVREDRSNVAGLTTSLFIEVIVEARLRVGEIGSKASSCCWSAAVSGSDATAEEEEEAGARTTRVSGNSCSKREIMLSSMPLSQRRRPVSFVSFDVRLAVSASKHTGQKLTVGHVIGVHTLPLQRGLQPRPNLPCAA